MSRKLDPSMSPSRGVKGRHQFRRRFSLQPSFFKESEEEEHNRPHNSRSERRLDEEICENPLAPNVRHRIVVMGAAKVGKSSIISQFLYSTFSPKYKRTVEEMHHGDFSVSGINLTLDILDTSGAYEFPAMRALSISSGDAFILVYDITDSDTFTEIRTLRDQILESREVSPAPIVVVANKIDLADESNQIDTETFESVVSLDWENGFVQASAKDNINVSKIFKELLSQAKVKYNLSPALRKRRRQSLSRHSISEGAGSVVPSPAQLQHLEMIRERHTGSKRNSCVIS
ncbi:ras-related protein Rap-1b [Anabrus simplex]|uniref:ras-related protein Rap-1b n=1 Tax=Anabrus simplex TaxID=316456 RepID=UPI0034DD34CE